MEKQLRWGGGGLLIPSHKIYDFLNGRRVYNTIPLPASLSYPTSLDQSLLPCSHVYIDKSVRKF